MLFKRAIVFFVFFPFHFACYFPFFSIKESLNLFHVLTVTFFLVYFEYTLEINFKNNRLIVTLRTKIAVLRGMYPENGLRLPLKRPLFMVFTFSEIYLGSGLTFIFAESEN